MKRVRGDTHVLSKRFAVIDDVSISNIKQTPALHRQTDRQTDRHTDTQTHLKALKWIQ